MGAATAGAAGNVTLITILSLITAMLAVFFGPLISWFIAKRRDDVSLKIAKKQVVAPIRQKWIDKLRDLIAEMLSIAHYYHIAQAGDDSDEGEQVETQVHRKMLFLHKEVKLLINPQEQEHRQLVDKLGKLAFGLNDRENWNSFGQQITDITELAQGILKTEWTRVKEEI